MFILQVTTTVGGNENAVQNGGLCARALDPTRMDSKFCYFWSGLRDIEVGTKLCRETL